MDNSRLAILGQFTPEGVLSEGYNDHYLFFVGRDDVHGILLYLLNHETLGFKCNMFGYDDQELNDAILNFFKTPSIKVQVTLDKSQAGGVHEKALLAADASNPDFNNSFVVGESATDQISHTKGGVFEGQGLWFEGSTNWSSAGEGTGISLKQDVSDPKGFKAQNNTLLVSVNPVGLRRFNNQLDSEHQIALQQQAKRLAKANGQAA